MAINEYIRRAIKAAMDKPDIASDMQKRVDKFWDRNRYKSKEDAVKFRGQAYADSIEQQMMEQAFVQVAESHGYKKNQLENFISDQGIDPDTMTPGRPKQPGFNEGNETGGTYGTVDTDERDARVAREQYGNKGEVFDGKHAKSSEDAFLERQQQKRDEEARDSNTPVRPGSQYNKDRTTPVDPNSKQAGESAAERGNKPYKGREDSRPEELEGPTEAANTDPKPVDADATGKVPTERVATGGRIDRNIENVNAYLEGRGIRLQVSEPQQPVNGQLVEFKTDSAILNSGKSQQTVILENAESPFGSPKSGATGSVLDGEIYLPKYEDLGGPNPASRVQDLRYNDTRGVLVVPVYGDKVDGAGPATVFERYLFEMNSDGPTPLKKINNAEWEKISHRYHARPSSNENSAFAVELNRSFKRYVDEGGDPSALESTSADDSRQARINRINQALYGEEGQGFFDARKDPTDKDLMWYEDNDQAYKLEPVQLGEFIAQGSLFNSGGMDATPIINESFRGLLPSKEEVSGVTQYRGTNTRGFIDSRHDLAGGRRLPNEEEATAAAADLARYTLQRENPLNPIYDQLEILRTGETTRSPDILKSGQPRRYYRKTNPDGSTTFETVPVPEDNEKGAGFTGVGGGGGGPSGMLGDLLKEKFEEIPNPPDTASGKRPFNDSVVEGHIIGEGGFNALADALQEIVGNEDITNLFEGLDDVTTRSFKDKIDPSLTEDDIRIQQFYARAKSQRINTGGSPGTFFEKPSAGRGTGELHADPLALFQQYIDRKASLERSKETFLDAYPQYKASPYNNRYFNEIQTEIDAIDEILGYDPVEIQTGQYSPDDVNRGNQTRTLDPLSKYDGLSRGMAYRLEKELDGVTNRDGIMRLIEKYKAELDPNSPASSKYYVMSPLPDESGMQMTSRMTQGLTPEGLALEKMVDYLENTLLGEADNMLQSKISGLRGQQQSYLGDIARLTNELVDQGVAPPEWVGQAIDMQLQDLGDYYDDISSKSIYAEQVRMSGDEQTLRADELKNQMAGVQREITKLKELQFKLDNEDLRKFNAVKAQDNPFPDNAFPVIDRYMYGAAEKIAEEQVPNWSTLSIDEKAEKVKKITEMFEQSKLGDEQNNGWDLLQGNVEQAFREEGLIPEGQEFNLYDTLFHRTDVMPGYTARSKRSYFSPRLQTTGSSELAQANKYIKREFQKAGVVPPMWLRESSVQSQQGMGVNRELLSQISEAEAIARNPNKPDGTPKTATEFRRDAQRRDALVAKSNNYKDNMSAAHQQFVENTRANGPDAPQYSIVGDNGGFYAPMLGTEEDPTAFMVWNRILEQNPEVLRAFSGKRDAADGLKEILFANYLKNMPNGGNVDVQNGYMKILADQQYAISKKLELQDSLNRYPDFQDGQVGIDSTRFAARANTEKQIAELDAIISKIDLRKREFLESMDVEGEIISAYDQIESDIATKMSGYVQQPQGPQNPVSNFNDVENSLAKDLENATDPATRQQLNAYMESVRQELNNLWGEDPTGKKTRTVTTYPEQPDIKGKGLWAWLESGWDSMHGKYMPTVTEEPILPNVTSVDEINRRRQQILANLPDGISEETISLIEKNLEDLTQVVVDRDRAIGSMVDRRQTLDTQPAADIPLNPEDPGGLRDGMPSMEKGNFGPYYIPPGNQDIVMDPAMQNLSMYFSPNKYAELRGLLTGRLNQADLDFASRATPGAAELARYNLPELQRMMADTLAELPPEAHVNMTFDGATTAKQRSDDIPYESENVNRGARGDARRDNINFDDITNEEQFATESQQAWDQGGTEGVNRDTPTNMLQRAIIKTEKDIRTIQEIVDTGRVSQRAYTMNPQQAQAELSRLQGLLGTLQQSQAKVSNLQEVIDFKKGNRGRPLNLKPENMNIGVGVNRTDEQGRPGLFASVQTPTDFDGEVTGGADETRKITKNFYLGQDFEGTMPENGDQFLEVQYVNGSPRLLYYPEGHQGKVIDVVLENLYRKEMPAAEVERLRNQPTRDVNEGLVNYALKNSPNPSEQLLATAARQKKIRDLAGSLAPKPGADARAQLGTAKQANRSDGQSTLGTQPSGNPNKVNNASPEGVGAGDTPTDAIRRELGRQGEPVTQEPLYTESRLSKMFTPKIRPLTDNPVRNIGNLMYDNPGYTLGAAAITGLGTAAAIKNMVEQRRAEESQQQQPPPPVQPEQEQPQEFNWRKNQPKQEPNWRRN